MVTASVALSTIPIAGCSSNATTAPNATASTQELVGGFAANSSRFDAVGSLLILAPDPFGGPAYPLQVCTGTLIDQDTVLTARHCIDEVRYTPNTTMTFALGPDASHPSASANVIAYQVAPGETYGGFSGMGHDLAVLQLDTPLATAPTATLASIGSDDVGNKFATFGFGDQLSSGAQGGTRQVGGVTVRAVSGKIYEQLFGDFDSFYEWYMGSPLPPECKDVEAIPLNQTVVISDGSQSFECIDAGFARGVYEFTLLEEFHEVYAGGARGDAQPCFGDSGGPLVHTDDAGKLVVYGVVSGSVPTDSGDDCDGGAIYAGLSAELIDFIHTSAAWKDPCAVASSTGVCDGTVARRCATLAEGGDRKELSFDCASVGSTCQTQKNGYVGCGEDDSSFSPPTIAGAPREAAAAAR